MPPSPYQVNPLSLLTPKRFDIIAKYIFAKHRAIDSSFPLDLYRHHLEVWNNCNEITNPDKSTFKDFVEEFDEILRSIKEEGFNSYISHIPTYKGCALNGAHRIAASILNHNSVCCIESALEEGQLDCSHAYFAKRDQYVEGGLSSFYSDEMALEYAHIKRNTFIVTLFPTAHDQIDRARDLIESATGIVYEKALSLTDTGRFNFVRTLYDGEDWLGGPENRFHGVMPKVRDCYGSSGPTTVFLVETKSPSVLPILKEEVRALFNVGKHSIHINDTYEETLRISQAAFNDNSLHFLNHSKNIYFPHFEHLLATLKHTINNHSLNFHDFCIGGSSTLTAYGLRQGEDLDYLHKFPEHKFVGHSSISSHNTELHNYGHSKDDILYNPANHFYYQGVKFASLKVIKDLKEKRREPKDLVDSDLISPII